MIFQEDETTAPSAWNEWDSGTSAKSSKLQAGRAGHLSLRRLLSPQVCSMEVSEEKIKYHNLRALLGLPPSLKSLAEPSKWDRCHISPQILTSYLTTAPKDNVKEGGATRL